MPTTVSNTPQKHNTTVSHTEPPESPQGASGFGVQANHTKVHHHEVINHMPVTMLQGRRRGKETREDMTIPLAGEEG